MESRKVYSKARQTAKISRSEIPYGAKICPNCRKKQGGKKKWIILGAVVIVAIGLSSGSKDDSANESPESQAEVAQEETTQEETTAIEYLEISPDDLLNSYEENEVKGDDMYEDKMMRLTGEIRDIGKDITENVYITFEPSDQFSITSVQCYFDDEEEIKKVMELKPGDTITVSGRCDGKFGNVFVKECVIEQ